MDFNRKDILNALGLETDSNFASAVSSVRRSRSW
jgi:hypothetical protein